ncbi:MAG: hydroxyacylglutathione hydrolase [Desulfobacteraceae bacterium]
MNIQQFRYGSDNLAYVLFRGMEAAAVDPGAVNAISSFIQNRGLALKYVVNTHTHPDHTTGNQAILNLTGAVYLDIDQLIRQREFALDGETVEVIHTPGHTKDSVVFHSDGILVTGDTLFTGKAGKCFTGDYKAQFESIKKLMMFPENTTIHAGHDYVKEYMNTAKKIEPDNKAIDEFLKTYSPDNVFSTLADEYRINPSLRFNSRKIIDVLKKQGLSVQTEYDRFRSVMSIV